MITHQNECCISFKNPKWANIITITTNIAMFRPVTCMLFLALMQFLFFHWIIWPFVSRLYWKSHDSSTKVTLNREISSSAKLRETLDQPSKCISFWSSAIFCGTIFAEISFIPKPSIRIFLTFSLVTFNSCHHSSICHLTKFTTSCSFLTFWFLLGVLGHQVLLPFTYKLHLLCQTLNILVMSLPQTADLSTDSLVLFLVLVQIYVNSLLLISTTHFFHWDENACTCLVSCFQCPICFSYITRSGHRHMTIRSPEYWSLTT